MSRKRSIEIYQPKSGEIRNRLKIEAIGIGEDDCKPYLRFELNGEYIGSIDHNSTLRKLSKICDGVRGVKDGIKE